MFCLKLKMLRENEGLSQQALAEKLNVSQSTVGMWESNNRKPNRKALEKIASLFNVSTDYLLGLTDNPTPQQYNKNVLVLSTKERQLIINFRELSAESQSYILSESSRLQIKTNELSHLRLEIITDICQMNTTKLMTISKIIDALSFYDKDVTRKANNNI